MIIVKTGLYGESASIMPECLFNRNEVCNMYPCCESQNVSCCYACKYKKCPSKCKKGEKNE